MTNLTQIERVVSNVHDNIIQTCQIWFKFEKIHLQFSLATMAGDAKFISWLGLYFGKNLGEKMFCWSEKLVQSQFGYAFHDSQNKKLW